MKLSLTLLFFVIVLFLINGIQARIFGGGGREENEESKKFDRPGHLKGNTEKRRPPRLGYKEPEEYGLVRPSPTESLLREVPVPPSMAPVVVDTERKTNNIRITLTDIDGGMESFSSGEILFFEDSFMLAFLESQSNGQGDQNVHPRSLIVVGQSNQGQPQDNDVRGRNRHDDDRTLLWIRTRRYVDIYSLMEWSCYFCSSSRNGDSIPTKKPTTMTSPTTTSRNGDNIPTRKPTTMTSPTTGTTTTSPIRRSINPGRTMNYHSPLDVFDDEPVVLYLDTTSVVVDEEEDEGEDDVDDPIVDNNDDFADEFTDDDDDGIFTDDQEVDDDESIFSEHYPTINEEDGGGKNTSDNDDDTFTLLFGNRRRQLGGDDEDEDDGTSQSVRFETLLCARLRAGPYPIFHGVGKCIVIFAN